MTQQQAWQLIARTVVLVLAVVSVAWFAWAVRGVLVLLLVAIILATGLSPVLDAIAGEHPARKTLRVPRALAILLLYLALVCGLALFVVVVIPPLADQIEALAQRVPTYLGQGREAFNALAQAYPLLQDLDERVVVGAEESIGNIGAVFAQASTVLRLALGVANAVLSFLLVLVLTFYLVVDAGTLKRGVLRLLPPGNRALANVVIERARVRIGAWLVGQMALSLIIGAATFIGLLVLGVPFALLLAVIAAIGELIPMLGPVVAAVPAVIIASFKSPLHGLLTVGLYILIQQLENHIVVPQVMRRAVDLPPVVVIVALLMGSELLGVVGAILALPVAAALSVVVSELVAVRDGRGEYPGRQPEEGGGPVSPPAADDAVPSG